MPSLRKKAADLRGLSTNPRLAWLGEEKLAWMEQTVRHLQTLFPSARVPVPMLVGAVGELKPTDTLWLPQARPLRKALKLLDWPGGNCAPEIVTSWKEAREAAASSGFGRATLVIFSRIEAERKLSCRRAIAKAGRAQLPMVFVEETFGDSPQPRDSRAALPLEPGGASFPQILVDGDDLVAIFRVAQQAIQRARGGQGPASILCLRRKKGPPSS